MRRVASRLGAELLNVSVDACGGMAGDTLRLARAIGEEGQRWSAGTWSAATIERQVLGTIATAVQKGNAMAVLVGYTRATQPIRAGIATDGPGEGSEE